MIKEKRTWNQIINRAQQMRKFLILSTQSKEYSQKSFGWGSGRGWGWQWPQCAVGDLWAGTATAPRTVSGNQRPEAERQPFHVSKP